MAIFLTSAPAPAEQPGVSLEVAVSGLRSKDGYLLACLTANPKLFPGCAKDPKAQKLRVPAADAAHLHFTGVLPGTYALAVLHDENGNGKIDMTLFLPREGVGVSRNPKPRMGPPSFKSAAFAVDSSDVSLAVTMQYIL